LTDSKTSPNISIKTTDKSALYGHPAAMKPLLPTAGKEGLAELSCEIFRKAGALSGRIPSPIVRTRAAALVREMNSYYSNLIEGHRTLPRDIEKALRQDFLENADQRANQHLNKAHIEVEELMLRRLQHEPDLSIHSIEFICWIHAEFYRRLPPELHWGTDRSGKSYKIDPGAFRNFEVDVGRHQPPHHGALPEFMRRFQQVYSSKDILATDQLIALAAAHHRLAWIHPFGDGNGRVIRLYSHAWLVKAKVDSFGLWTLSRGLARERPAYFQQLSAADQTRWNDYDGRGNLSDRALNGFCQFILKTMLDQIEFMSHLFQFDVLARRIEAYLQIERVDLPSKHRERLAKLLKAALLEGQLDRGRAGEILGMSESGARSIVRLAVEEGLLDSLTEKGPLSLVFSSKTLESYFPKLYGLT
jgi:Fic family protein